MISFTEGGILLNRGKSVDFAVIAYDNIVFNIGAGTDAYVFSDFRTWSDESGTVYGVSHGILFLFKTVSSRSGSRKGRLSYKLPVNIGFAVHFP